MIRVFLLWFSIPAFATLSQICMKFVSLSFSQKTLGTTWLIEMSHSPWFWASIILDIAGFLSWVTVLKNTKISIAFPLTSVSFVTVLIASNLIFNEQITLQHYIGTLFLLFGIYLLSKNDKLKT
jgi:drug/metabolite transporter (DMT)-like permease